jgi:hypothetical protein
MMLNFSRLASIAALSFALSACSNSTQSFAPVSNAGNAASTLDSWRHLLAQKGLPGAGCFMVRYPSVQWNRVACSTPPHLWFPMPRSRRKVMPQNVGDGHDYTADTSPDLISTAIGAFHKVKGVKSVTSDGCCGLQGLNSYSLQLNSDFFQTVACGKLPNCVGWEQFVYSNPPGTSEGSLFIQDWLVATKGSFSSCPPSSGWENVGIGCVQNSPYGVNIPNVSITDLKQLVETGVAASTGDSIYLAVGSTEYGMQNVQSDGITDLAEHWMGAEFNVFGNGGGDIADFTGKPQMTVSVQTDTGKTTAPACPPNTGTTAEENNLFFVEAPKKPGKLEYPSIRFTMSTQSNGTPTCDTVPGT